MSNEGCPVAVRHLYGLASRIEQQSLAVVSQQTSDSGLVSFCSAPYLRVQRQVSGPKVRST